MNDLEKSIVCKKIIENEPINKVSLLSTTKNLALILIIN